MIGKRGTNTAMARRSRPPLDEASLRGLALAYVGRFATTRAKLRSYLRRKIRERGWEGTAAPDLDGVAERFAGQGYIDDGGYALMKSRALTGRGYGKRRLKEALHAAGVGEEDRQAAFDHADGEAIAAALRFAERRRIGPYATGGAPDPKEQSKAIAAMIRAGHSFDLARTIVGLPPGASIDAEELALRHRN